MIYFNLVVNLLLYVLVVVSMYKFIYAEEQTAIIKEGLTVLIFMLAILINKVS